MLKLEQRFYHRFIKQKVCERSYDVIGNEKRNDSLPVFWWVVTVVLEMARTPST
jgi:hypothetical protein